MSDRPYRAMNGMTLIDSEKTPDSRLARIVRYIALNGPTTKRDLIRYALDKSHKVDYNVRGYASTVFGLARKYGHLTMTRKGKTVLWGINPKSNVLGPEGVA